MTIAIKKKYKPQKRLVFKTLARLPRFERGAFRLGGGPSILVRYGGKQKGL